MSRYTPDDRIIEGEEGKRRVAEALKQLGSGVITSRDRGINDVLFDHFRPNMPAGVSQWQLPVKLEGPVFAFLSVMDPGAVVPTHAHKRDLFRVVVSGTLMLDDGRELKAGDWMFVPAKVEYSLRAGLNPGAISFHVYGPEIA